MVHKPEPSKPAEAQARTRRALSTTRPSATAVAAQLPWTCAMTDLKTSDIAEGLALIYDLHEPDQTSLGGHAGAPRLEGHHATHLCYTPSARMI